DFVFGTFGGGRWEKRNSSTSLYLLHRSRPIRPTSGVASASADLRPDVLCPQLRLSAGTVGTSGGSGRAAIYRERLPLRRGPRPREIFRPSESRPLDGSSRPARERYTRAEARSRVAERRGLGERLGQCNGGRDAARRAPVTVVVEHRTARI